MKWATLPIPRTADAHEPLDELAVLYGKKLFIGRSVKEGGLRGWQPATTAALLAAWDVTESSAFFDVGANIGMYASLHARLRPTATTVAFEPTPDVATSGESITAENDLSTRWERVALSDTQGEATLFLSDRTDASNSLVSRHRQAKGTVTVPTITLDSYVRTSGLVPSVVKIDVELHEPAVIRGAAEILDVHRPVVVAELLPGRAESDDVQQLMAKHGYEARPIEHPSADRTAETREPVRDWLFWPGDVPTAFDEAFAVWFAAVGRCGPASDNSA